MLRSTIGAITSNTRILFEEKEIKYKKKNRKRRFVNGMTQRHNYYNTINYFQKTNILY